jgi:hypothetical protein
MQALFLLRNNEVLLKKSNRQQGYIYLCPCFFIGGINGLSDNHLWAFAVDGCQRELGKTIKMVLVNFGGLVYPGLPPSLKLWRIPSPGLIILYNAESNPTIYRDTIYRGEWNRT